MTVSADYNEGYTYNGFAIVEDSSLGFTFSNTTDIDPLDTKGMHYLIECPQEVADNTEAPLFVVLTVEGEKYQITLR